MSALEVKTLQSPNNFNLTLDAQGSGSDIIIKSNGSQVASITDAGLLTATTFAGSGASLTNLPVQKPSISDGGNATAITIDANEYVVQNNLPFIFWDGGDNFNTRTLAAGNVFFNTAQASQAAIDYSGSGTLTGQASNGITYASGTGRFTVPVAGRYHISAHFKYAETTDQAVTVAIYTNSNHAVAYSDGYFTEHGTIQVIGCANLAANDYIDFRNVTGSRAYYMADTHCGGEIFLIG